MIVALIALFVALGGTTYAAVNLPANSVGTNQLKNGAVIEKKLANNSVTSGKVRDRSLLVKDFKAGQLPAGLQGPRGLKGDTGATGARGPMGDRGPQGLMGDTGARGLEGPTGPSDVYQAWNNAYVSNSKTLTLTLPAGSYAIVAKVVASASTANPTGASCHITPAQSFDDFSLASLPGGAGKATLSDAATDVSASPFTITYSCISNAAFFYQMRIVATKVGMVH